MPSVSDDQEIYVGNIVTGGNRKTPLVKENTALVVKDGTIVAKGCARSILDRYDGEVIALGEHEFLAPGFVDAHLHAPQFKNGGLNQFFLSPITIILRDAFGQASSRLAAKLYISIGRQIQRCRICRKNISPCGKINSW